MQQSSAAYKNRVILKMLMLRCRNISNLGTDCLSRFDNVWNLFEFPNLVGGKTSMYGIYFNSICVKQVFNLYRYQEGKKEIHIEALRRKNQDSKYATMVCGPFCNTVNDERAEA